MIKTMTCKQLGGACEKEFHANTFEEISAMSKKHGMEMFKLGDEAHKKAMNQMKKLMENPEKMEQWIKSKREEFNALPEN